MTPGFEKTVLINSDAEKVWTVLTEPQLMKQWMGSEEMAIQIQTDWKAGSPIVIRGVHHLPFENKGIILQYEPNKTLCYTHLSSLSSLEDKADNYSVIQFRLTSLKDQTALQLTIENFPTEDIYKHLTFFWRIAIEKIKAFAEQNAELVN